MAAFLIKRLGFNAAVLVLILVVVSLLLRLVPTDPVDVMTFGGFNPVTAATKAQMRANLGLTGSPIAQVGRYIAGLAHGNLGESLLSRQPVRQIIFERLPASIELTLAG